MADLAVWQRTIVDEEGNVIPGAEVEVRREEDGSLATLYADRAGETPLANPLAADMSGFVRFFAQGDAYTITAVGAGSTRTWRFDPTGRLKEFDRISDALAVDDGADTAEARSLLGTFSTVADVQNSHIPAVLESIRAFGRDAPGDGPPLDLVRGSEVPGAVRSADGQWWEDLGHNTITVKIPSDFPTLQEAIDHYSRLQMRSGAKIELLIESGHILTSGVAVEDGDFGKFIITAEDEEVFLSNDWAGGSEVILGVRAVMPVLGCLINANRIDGVTVGYSVTEGSAGSATPDAGIKNVAGSCLYVHGSRFYGRYTIWTGGGTSASGGGGSGATAWGSTMDVERADFSDSLGYGCQAAHGSIVNARHSKANNAGRYGYRATDGSVLEIDGGEANDCGENAVRAFNGCVINASPFTGKNAGARGVVAAGASLVNIQNSDFSGAGDFGIHATTGSVINANSANARRGSADTGNDIIVTSGGTINATSATGGRSQSINIPSNEGVIYDRNAPEMHEYGDFEVTVSSSSGSWSVPTNQCRYVRVGRVVHAWIRIVATPSGSPSGTLYINGLPYPAAGVSLLSAEGSLMLSRNNIDKPGYTDFVPTIEPSESRIYIHANGAGQSADFLRAQDLTGNFAARIQITYLISDYG